MPRPQPHDFRLERLCASGWLLLDFGTQREMNAGYRALTGSLELIHVRFRVLRPDGKTEVDTGDR